MTVMCVNFNKGLLFRFGAALLEKPGDSDADIHNVYMSSFHSTQEMDKNNSLVPILTAVF